MKLYKQNESYIFIECDLPEAIDLRNHFSFYADNYFWSPKYKSGVWDGKIYLFDMKKGLLPIGLYHELKKYLENLEIKYVSDPELERKGWKLTPEKINEFSRKIIKYENEPRYYQTNAVRFALYEKRGVILSPTASGKSLIAFLIFNMLQYIYRDYKFLLIVPTTSLVEQMTGDFIDYGKNFCDYNQHIQKIYSSQERKSDKSIVISTWQSLQHMPVEYFKQFNCVICDEGHTASAVELSNIMLQCVNAEYKLAMSGTLKESKVNQLQLVGLFGRIYKTAKTSELMSQGFLSKLKIISIALGYPTEERQRVSATSKAKNKVPFTWQEECAYINSQEYKIRLMKKIVEPKKNSLILFKTIEYGKRIFDYCTEKMPDKKIFYVDGTVKATDREKYRHTAEKNDNVIIIASYGTFSTGINIKNLHNIVFGESTDSVIKVLQSVGRLLRLNDNKDCAVVYDIGDDLSWKQRQNHTLKHFLHRSDIYQAENFHQVVKTINMPKVNN